VPSKQKTESRQVRQEILHHWREAAPDDRFAHLVRDAGRSCVRALQIRLARESLSFGLWAFLRILWHADGITQRDLSVRAGVMEPTTFTGLKALVNLGYITRKQAPNNKKNVYIHLTPKGRALKKKLEPLAEEVNRIAVRGVPPANVAVTRKTLLAVIENLVRDEIASTAKLRPLRARSNGIAWRKSLLRLGGLAREKCR
jgi:MarR family transcriptional regulator, organic hydroperoxide resistance regulator